MLPAEDFRSLEETLWRAETRYDQAHLERVLHPDFVEFGRSGATWTRDDTLRSEPAAIDAELTDFTVHPLAADTVLVTYRTAVRHESLDYANRSSLWQRTAVGWQLRFHQATPTRP
jgi:hypothetical protein